MRKILIAIAIMFVVQTATADWVIGRVENSVPTEDGFNLILTVYQSMNYNLPDEVVLRDCKTEFKPGDAIVAPFIQTIYGLKATECHKIWYIKNYDPTNIRLPRSEAPSFDAPSSTPGGFVLHSCLSRTRSYGPRSSSLECSMAMSRTSSR